MTPPRARNRECLLYWLLYHEFKVGDGVKAEIQSHDQSSMDSGKHSDLSSNLPGCLRLFRILLSRMSSRLGYRRHFSVVTQSSVKCGRTFNQLSQPNLPGSNWELVEDSLGLF